MQVMPFLRTSVFITFQKLQAASLISPVKTKMLVGNWCKKVSIGKTFSYKWLFHKSLNLLAKFNNSSRFIKKKNIPNHTIPHPQKLLLLYFKERFVLNPNICILPPEFLFSSLFVKSWSMSRNHRIKLLYIEYEHWSFWWFYFWYMPRGKKKSDHRIWKETGGDVYGTKNCY